MGRKFNWKTLSFEAEPANKFSSDPIIYDGEVVTTVDQRIKMTFTGGLAIGRTEAMSLPGVKRGRDQICASIASLPLVCYKADNSVVANELLREINPVLTNGVVKTRTLEDMLFDGVAYWRNIAYGSNGYPIKAEHVPVARVSENEDTGEIWIDGKLVDPNDIIRFNSPNDPLLKSMSGIIKRALALAATSDMYARNPKPSIIFSPKSGDVNFDPVAFSEAIQAFVDTANTSSINAVGAGIDVNKLDWLSPADLQLIELEKNIERGIANALGLDPEDLGISTTSRTYQNATDRRKDKINDLLNPYMQAIEERLTKGDVTPRGYFVKFSQDDYLRADPKTRMEVNTGYLDSGVLTRDEVRAKEGLPPMTPEQKAELKPQVSKSPALEAPAIEASFSADEETAFSFESAEFSEVKAESRTVKVLAVPYGEPSSLKGGRKFVFSKGSIKYPDNLRKIKLLRDHDYSQSNGYATNIEETDAGLVLTFQIASGEAGDRALAGFADGNYDAVSIGVEFDTDGVTKDSKTGHYFVRSARLKEVSQVSIPAFENAGLISVQASGQGEEMTDTNLDGAVNAAPEKSYTLAEFQAMQATFGKPAEAPASVQENTNVAPREVKGNAQEKEVTSVSEPSPYGNFDGKSTHEFSTDIIAGLQFHDPAALKRVNTFLAEEFAVTTTNASSLNPIVNRSDLYVDQLDYEYPIWNTINRGALQDITAFKFPKFNAASGLVADHVEGVEPTLGSASWTDQTVTPKALSGKIEVNREAWDQGGSPSLSQAIMASMRRAWYEGLETYAASRLDAYTLAAGLVTTLTTAAVDNALYKEVTRATAKLKFTRGGYRLTDFLAHEDLFVNLMLAEDAQDRPLFPMINPVNANGGSTPRMGLTINGLALKPAWALGAAGTVAENSYLLTPEDVAAWASAPQFLELNVQVKSIYLGIWGYAAFAVQRDEGLRRFVYDPAV